MKLQQAKRLLESLRADPEAFVDDDHARELALAFPDKLPLKVLRELLHDPQPGIRRAAVFVASEMDPDDSEDVLEIVAPFCLEEDPWTADAALHVIGDVDDLYGYVGRALLHPNAGIRTLAMKMLATATENGLETAFASEPFGSMAELDRRRWVRQLADGTLSTSLLVEALASPNAMVRKLGAIGVEKTGSRASPLWSSLQRSADEDLRVFSREPPEMLKPMAELPPELPARLLNALVAVRELDAAELLSSGRVHRRAVQPLHELKRLGRWTRLPSIEEMARIKSFVMGGGAFRVPIDVVIEKRDVTVWFFVEIDEGRITLDSIQLR